MDLIFRFSFHIDYLSQGKNYCDPQLHGTRLLNKIISEIMSYSRSTRKKNAIKCLIKTRFTQIDYSKK